MLRRGRLSELVSAGIVLGLQAKALAREAESLQELREKLDEEIDKLPSMRGAS